MPAGVRVIELPSAPMPIARALALAADPAGLRAMLAPVLLAWRPPKHLPHLPGLVRYLRAERPDALFAAMPTPNLLAVWARRLAGVPTRVLVSERNTLSAMLGGRTAGAIAICRACSGTPTGWRTASSRSRTGSPTTSPGKPACRARASPPSTIP